MVNAMVSDSDVDDDPDRLNIGWSTGVRNSSSNEPAPPSKPPPAPDYVDRAFYDLGSLMEQAAMLKNISPSRQMVTPQVLINMRKMADGIQDVTRRFMLHALRDQIITQKQAAEIIGVHENTVARWVKEDQARRQT
ncbi:helix-turn-helix domain-containing protein [Pseudonocardia broussonetiae]|uniref:Uncharacterized protein n=1 Tax=Pseudonocardia broussonetiae TaxID=2736640 RepID=A0A6M6JYL6_9PSEU|nr:helix-turn-helix domain-containing protein [Pseudonocardia broussonetiae]QJY51201.1 hypothetical protein HOP40_35035 [Pseudonocardia broussonetiae]QJY51215.1 hypothetical protein HOP40_35110 [Pseudonocardia broussonetiae]